MPEEALQLDIAAGHTITGTLVPGAGPLGLLGSGWTYSCSCGEIADVATDVAQAHAEDVTP